MSSHIKDSQHDDAHGIKRSHVDSCAYELHNGAPKSRPGKEPSGSLLRDQVLMSEKFGTLPGESRTDRRSPFKAEELTGERRSAEYHAEEQTPRRSHRVERHRPSSSTMRYRPRVSRERHRKLSKSPRRRRSFDEHRYREEHGRRRCSFSPASLGYLLRRRYSSLSFAVSRSHSRSGVLYRRTQWPPACRAYDPVRSTQSDRHRTQLHRERSVETVPHEGDGRHGGAMSPEQAHSRIIETDRPVEDGENSGVERVIPKAQLAGHPLEDPRREDYAAGSRHDSHLQEYELIDLTVSTDEKHYEAQHLYGSCDGSLELHYQSTSGYARPCVSRTCAVRWSDIYHPESHDIGFPRRHTLQRCDYPGQEGPDMRVKCLRSVESLANYCPRCPRPEEYPAICRPVGPRPEECLVHYCPRPLYTALYVGEDAIAGGSPSRGFRNVRNKLRLQKVTMRGTPLMRQRPPNGGRTWFHYQREMADRAVEAMIHTIRAQNYEVDALRADMRDLRTRIANFVAEERKAQQESLAFIAAVKQLMAERTERRALNHTVHR